MYVGLVISSLSLSLSLSLFLEIGSDSLENLSSSSPNPHPTTLGTAEEGVTARREPEREQGNRRAGSPYERKGEVAGLREGRVLVHSFYYMPPPRLFFFFLSDKIPGTFLQRRTHQPLKSRNHPPPPLPNLAFLFFLSNDTPERKKTERGLSVCKKRLAR